MLQLPLIDCVYFLTRISLDPCWPELDQVSYVTSNGSGKTTEILVADRVQTVVTRTTQTSLFHGENGVFSEVQSSFFFLHISCLLSKTVETKATTNFKIPMK